MTSIKNVVNQPHFGPALMWFSQSKGFCSRPTWASLNTFKLGRQSKPLLNYSLCSLLFAPWGGGFTFFFNQGQKLHVELMREKIGGTEGKNVRVKLWSPLLLQVWGKRKQTSQNRIWDKQKGTEGVLLFDSLVYHLHLYSAAFYYTNITCVHVSCILVLPILFAQVILSPFWILILLPTKYTFAVWISHIVFVTPFKWGLFGNVTIIYLL